jgi:hypothetical protein
MTRLLFRQLPAELQSAVEAAWRAGERPRTIADRYGVSEESVRRRFDKAWGERRNQGIREARQRRRVAPSYLEPGADQNRATRAEVRADAARLAASIPRDTRSLTARVFGDPLSGRSALDKERMRRARDGATLVAPTEVPSDG